MRKANLLMPEFSDEAKDSFFQKVGFTANPNCCWEWSAGMKSSGYGNFYFNGKDYTATRVSYFLHFNIDPKELLVLHRCDNPKCVNPNHLFLGDDKANSDDMIQKGRDIKVKGEDHPISKLLESDIAAIRGMSEKKISSSIIATKFGISVSTVRRVARYSNWSHLREGMTDVEVGEKDKNDFAIGSRHGHSRLVEADVVEMRRQYATGVAMSDIVRSFNIHQSAVSRIINRKRWTHI